MRSTLALISPAISIHAPREGGDDEVNANNVETYSISIHAPREGGDIPCTSTENAQIQFQSTPPARGATTLVVLVHNLSYISIHAPREGGD